MNEEVSKETVNFAANSAKVTGRFLLNCLRAYLRHRQNKKMTAGKGEQTVKQLIKQGQGASSMEVSGESIKDFKRIANKYGVDFAIVKDKTIDPPRYTCFFKAKDVDAITAVVKEYSAKVVKLQGKSKPSLLKELARLKEEIAKKPRRVKEKFKENVR
jgi:hypothetical protein